MTSILFGTTNPGKLDQVRKALLSINIDVEGLESYLELPDVIEDGQTAQENARKKALAYARATGRTVFAMDNALYFAGVRPEDQPGIHPRRIPGYTERPNDDEVLAYYTNLIDRYGGSVPGYWEFAIAVARPSGELIERTTRSAPHHFLSSPSRQRIPGYPLDSLQFVSECDAYTSELPAEKLAEFWDAMIGAELRSLVQAIQETNGR